MAKLIFLIAFGSVISWAQSIEKLSVQKIEADFRLEKHRYGGISSIIFSDGFLWALSDDRGSQGPPRMYKQSLEKNVVKPLSVIALGDVKGVNVLDPEAFVRFKDGKFLISSEGDFDKKPRVMPMVRYWSEKEKWLIEEVPLTDELLPEKIGMQTKGLQNNSAFEAMALSDDEKTLYLISEVPLYQNQKSECEFLEFEIKNGKWILAKRRGYKRDLAPDGAIEVMRGISDALYWKKNHLLVLERWVRLDKKRAIVMGAELFSVEISASEKEPFKKKRLFTLDGDLAGNWEGLAWGPHLSDGRKGLILVSDNNFVKSTPTQYLFLAFSEK